MAISYTLNLGGTSTMVAGRKGTQRFFTYTFTQRRSYMKFDMSGEGLSLGDVDYVQLHTYCHSVFGGTHSYFLRHSLDPNGWGTTLEANQADFVSTADNLQDTLSIGSTGWKIWDVDKNDLDFTDWNYFRITTASPGVGSNNSAGFRTQNYGTASQRPFLRFTLVSGAVVNVPLLPLMGVGS